MAFFKQRPWPSNEIVAALLLERIVAHFFAPEKSSTNNGLVSAHTASLLWADDTLRSACLVENISTTGMVLSLKDWNLFMIDSTEARGAVNAGQCHCMLLRNMSKPGAK